MNSHESGLGLTRRVPSRASSRIFIIVLLVLFLVGMISVACGGRRARRLRAVSPPQPPVASSPVPGEPRSPVAPPDMIQPGLQERFVTSQGRSRSYLVYIPRGYTANRPVPVVLVFHGALGNAANIEQMTGWSKKAEEEDFIVVYPNGSGRFRRFLVWNAGICCGYALEHGIDDVAFVRVILSDLSSVVRIDSDRVFATGFSNGGMLSHRLGCELSDRITAIASVAGTLGINRCRPDRPVSVLHIHGLADPEAPYGGGRGSHSKISFEAAPRTVERWAAIDGCLSAPRVTFARGPTSCSTYRSCQGGSEVTICSVDGLGHVWPGGAKDTSRGFYATDFIWEFFKRAGGT